jgi:uncharacterized protein (TIGR00251 family)
LADVPPYRMTAGGLLRIAVKLTPRASRDAVQGIERDAGGTARLKVMVRALPEAGKANAALIKLLAKVWKIPRSSLDIAAGETSRLKELELKGEALPVIDWLKAFQNDHAQEDL